MFANTEQRLDAAQLQQAKLTTTLREWFGFTGVVCWFFNMAMSYYSPVFENVYIVVVFCIIIGISVITVAVVLRDHVLLLARIANVTTPLCLVITATAPLFPTPIFVTLYYLTALLAAPALVRRAYGLLLTCSEDKRFRFFASGLATASFLNIVFSLLITSLNGWFFLTALYMIPAWLGITREVIPIRITRLAARAIGIRTYLLLGITILLFALLSTLSAYIHTFLLIVGNTSENPLLAFFIAILPALAFIFYAWLADKKLERVGFYIAVTLFLIGLIIVLVPDNPLFFIILAISDGIGGTYAEFFIVTFSIYFFIGSRNLLLMCSLGLAVDACFFWLGGLWSPAFLMADTAAYSDGSLEPILLVVCALTVILIFLFVSWLMNRQNENSAEMAITSLLFQRGHHDSQTEEPDEDSSIEIAKSAVPTMGLLPKEQYVANLLIEGHTRGEIARKLKLTAAEVREMLLSIQNKIATVDTADESADSLHESLAWAVQNYGLTTRETQILRSFFEGKTNVEIAEELFVAESTVRTHIKSLMKKLPISSRAEVREWLLTGAKSEGESAQKP